MSTALVHHNRAYLGAASVLALVTTGVLIGVVRDNTGSTTHPNPGVSTPTHTIKLTGTDHQAGRWKPAGTTSGGRTQLGD